MKKLHNNLKSGSGHAITHFSSDLLNDTAVDRRGKGHAGMRCISDMDLDRTSSVPQEKYLATLILTLKRAF